MKNLNVQAMTSRHRSDTASSIAIYDEKPFIGNDTSQSTSIIFAS